MSADPVVHVDALPWVESAHGELFASKRRKISEAAGGRRLGCSLFEVAPGKTAFPFHYHLANEEALYVLSGEGTLRLGQRRFAVRAGDYVAFPCEAEAAHQLTNTGPEPLRYLMISTMVEPDVMVYPDSDRVGVMAGSAPGGDPRARTLSAFFPRDSAVGYFHGEPGDTGDASGRPSASAPPDEDQAGTSRLDATLESIASKLGLGRLAAAGTRIGGSIEEKLTMLERLLDRDEAQRAAAARAAEEAAERERATAEEIDAQLEELRKKLKLDE